MHVGEYGMIKSSNTMGFNIIRSFLVKPTDYLPYQNTDENIMNLTGTVRMQP